MTRDMTLRHCQQLALRALEPDDLNVQVLRASHMTVAVRCN